MSCDGERPEGAEVAAVFQSNKAEREDDEEDGFFVDVPAEEEGGVAAEGERADECFPGGVEEEFRKADLRRVVVVSSKSDRRICLG